MPQVSEWVDNNFDFSRADVTAKLLILTGRHSLVGYLESGQSYNILMLFKNQPLNARNLPTQFKIPNSSPMYSQSSTAANNVVISEMWSKLSFIPFPFPFPATQELINSEPLVVTINLPIWWYGIQHPRSWFDMRQNVSITAGAHGTGTCSSA